MSDIPGPDLTPEGIRARGEAQRRKAEKTQATGQALSQLGCAIMLVVFVAIPLLVFLVAVFWALLFG